jgi:hypothetical protein
MRRSSAGEPEKAYGKQFSLDRLKGKSTALHVPGISSYRAAGRNDPYHLGNAVGGIGNEKNHQRHNG